MRILITNDDGIDAPGIAALAGALGNCGDITVIAPATNQSGVSAALTLRRSIAVSTLGGGRFAVCGTPADCVHLAISGGFAPRPDIVVSGINDGSNLGEDTIYSGTVAAAVCAHLHNIPALALSVAAGRADKRLHYDGACRAAKQLVQSGIIQSGIAAVVNVNAPNIPAAEVKGMRITRLGRRAESSAAIPRHNNENGEGENGKMHFVIGPSGPAKDGGEGTDFFAVAGGYVALTPLVVAGVESCTTADIGKWLQ